MANALFTPVWDGSTSLNGLIAMFINQWSGNKTELNLVECQKLSASPVFPVKSELKGQVIPDLASLTTLPFLVVAERENTSRLIVSGLAAVSRHMIKESNDPAIRKSLSFRGNCLQAPAECSIWTSFCEVQMIQSTVDFLTQPVTDVVEIPTALVKLEEHFKQPVRMHNIVKRWQDEEPKTTNVQLPQGEIQKLAATLLDHTFSEGPDMTLADLLLFPCAIILTDRLLTLGIKISDYLPRVGRWLNIMKPLVEDAWRSTVGESSLDLSLLRIQPQPNVKVPRVKEASLYKKDSTRPGVGNLSSEETTRVVDLMTEQQLWLESNEDTTGLVSHIDIAPCTEFVARIDWSTLPDPVHPQQGHVPGSRLERKIQQLDGMAAAVIDAVSVGDVIVDFCSGGGHLGILLAYLLPRCHVIMVDNKEESVRHARERVAQLHLTNVTLIQSNLDYFQGSFNLGVALHACGVATDLVLQACLTQRAAFVLCPCCYGNLAHPDLPIRYPQSRLYSKRGVLPPDFSTLARMADHLSSTGRLAMASVDLDRVCRAAQDDYRVMLKKLKPDLCSPKHDLLIGIPSKTTNNN